MSLGYGGQADPWNWGSDDTCQEPPPPDSNNCWIQPTSATQNYNYQHPKEQHILHGRAVNQPRNDYFDSVELHSQQNPGEQFPAANSWPYHHPPPQPGNYPTTDSLGYTAERVNNNNNNTSSEVENREIAPPDNKHSRNGSDNEKQGFQEIFDQKPNFYPSNNHQGPPKHSTMSHNGGRSNVHRHFTPSLFAPPATSSPLGLISGTANSGQPFPPPSDRNPVPPITFTSTQSEQPSSLPNFSSVPLFSDLPNPQRPPNAPSPNKTPSMQAAYSFQPQPASLPYSPPEIISNVERFTPTPPGAATSGGNNPPPPAHPPMPFPNPPLRPSFHIPELENVPATLSYNAGYNLQNSNSKQRSPSPNYPSPLPPHNSVLPPQPSQTIPENQERIPENRERLDNTEDIQLQLSSLRINQVELDSQQHCSVDRNQYLETGQLSTITNVHPTSGISNTEITDEGEAPPPGLHRLVTGQGCENREEVEAAQAACPQPEPASQHDTSRRSTPLSSIGDQDMRRGQSETEGELENVNRRQGGDLARLVPGQSVGDDATSLREVPGEAEPLQGRVVLGRTTRGDPTPPADPPSSRGDPGRDRDRERENDVRLERMVLGEIRSSNKQIQNQSNSPEDYKQQHRGRHKHRRDSSYEEEERDYSSDRERRHEDYRRRDDRHRRRREHRSPEYRSDEEYEERREYSRSSRPARERRHERDYSPEYYDFYRDSHRRRRRYDHYGRGEYEDDYYYRENRSRPSSRTGSRHYFQDHSIPGMPYRDYERSMKEYFENMRRTDPIAYTMWYNQYMSRCASVGMQQSQTYSNDRASVHSGQSSSNQRHNVHTPHDTVDDAVPGEDSLAIEDFTPRLYSTAHVRGNMDSHGRLVVVEAHYPVDGQRASVQLCGIGHTTGDPGIMEFLESPGPFVFGVTHRNTVLQYLRKMSDRAGGSSEKLLYDLIHLTVKTNGVVNGSDVAELLMESYKKSNNGDKDRSESSNIPPLSQTDIIARFRELLQQGNKTEALEWAMEHRAWGHALFLASKMDDRSHQRVMLRFANSVPHNDPLQTLYQLMSGYVPQASTHCADKKWADWRPHLAMILSNPTYNPNLDRKAIITLGDSLGARGRLFASHFCYVTAQVEFSPYQPDAKLVLLGSSSNQEFSKFASCRAIMLTMCYEYGMKLHRQSFSIPTLQVYKLVLATHLIDNGKNQVALQYCELLANEIDQIGLYDRNVTSSVIELATRLKMFDPTLALSGDTEKEPEWLTRVRHIYENSPEDYDPSSLVHGVSTSTLSDIGQDVQHDHMMNQPQEQVESIPLIETQMPSYAVSELPASQHGLSQAQAEELPPEQHPFQGYHQPPQQDLNGYQPDLYRIETSSGGSKYWENGNVSNFETPKLPESSSSVPKPGFSFHNANEEQLKPREPKEEAKPKEVRKTDKRKNKNEEQSGGWFDGILEKLALRPKNQMRLPDDSNPSIVWDQDKKQWVNLDGDEEDRSEMKPPPRAAETQAPVHPLGGNKYKLQKGKLMKSNYVDVMSQPGGGGGRREAPGLLPAPPAPPINPHLFVPAPVEGNENAPIDFITSASHLRAEGIPEPSKEAPVPMMYNPANFSS